MNRIIIFIFIIFLSCDYGDAQNLVSNNEFEDTVFCPSGLDQTSAATGWRSYAGTPDYFNTCSYSIFSRVPSNYFGYQQPSSGKAYASFYAYYTNYPNYREYVGTTLNTPLTAGTKYFISFKVALADKHEYNRRCNNLGMKFTNWDYWSGWPAPVNNSAHVYSTAVISDTANWTRISGWFIADSNYLRVMVGNFFDDAGTVNIGDSTQYGSYYYLDDICVSTDSAYCYNYMDVPEEVRPAPVSVFPNPFSTQTTFSSDAYLGNASLKVYDLVGREMKSLNFSGTRAMLNREGLGSGIYFYRIIAGDKAIAGGKLIVND